MALGDQRVVGRDNWNGRDNGKKYGLVVVSLRLPVEANLAGEAQWATGAGGLVSALRPVIAETGGAWVGWTGQACPIEVGGADHEEGFQAWGKVERPGAPERTGEIKVVTTNWGAPGEGAPPPEDVHALPVLIDEEEVGTYYYGFCNATLWPLYHDAVAPPVYSRRWWHAYVEVNQRFAAAVAAHTAPGATVWVHDYQLQLVPAMLRGLRSDLQIGWFNHIPFPPVDLFSQLPWRREVLEGILGADLVGFQTAGGAANFLRSCRRFTGCRTQGSLVEVVRRSGEERRARVGAFPISVDARQLSDLAESPEVHQRARQIREDLGQPEVVLLGVDRLDYTKGLLHRLRAYAELLEEGRLGPPEAVLVQVASPSRDEVEQYKKLREDVERVVGAINGDFSPVGRPAVHYLHQSFPREEMAALYLASDVALVTPLRDGMNLVAKEYVACRPDEGGRLVLSEMAGAAAELREAWLVNPHDIDQLKGQVMAAVTATREEAAWRIRRMRRRVFAHDVHRWAAEFLGALGMARQEQDDHFQPVTPGEAEPDTVELRGFDVS